MKRYRIGYTAGVFDLLHEGHINILKRAKEQCEKLIVAVTTDELCLARKNHKPVIPFEERCAAIEDTGLPNIVIAQKDMDKLRACLENGVDAVFVGSDWKDTEYWNDLEKKLMLYSIPIVYLARTPNCSSTALRNLVLKYDICFYRDMGGYSILQSKSKDIYIDIPDSIGVYPVVEIESRSFAFSPAKRIRVGNNVSIIGDEAFFGCEDLERIQLPSSLRKIGKAAFWGCSNLRCLDFPPGMMELPEYLAQNCNALTKVTIPESVTRIHQKCFDYDSPCVREHNGVLYINNWVIGAKIDKNEAVYVVDGCVGIADAAFLANTSLASIKLPSSIRYVGAFSFDGSGIWNKTKEGDIVYADNWAVGIREADFSPKAIMLKRNTIGIGDLAFACNRDLSFVNGLENVRFIGRSAFKGCPRLSQGMSLGGNK